jgi:hypothetical protein
VKQIPRRLTTLMNRVPDAWPVLVIAAPAMVAVWSGWVGLSKLTGFGDVNPLPGIWDGLKLNTSITLAIGVEAYGAYAIKAALSASRMRTRGFAAASGVLSLALGAYGQMQYHLLVQQGASKAPEGVTKFVSVLPIVVVGLAAVLYELKRSDEKAKLAANQAHAAALAEAERDAAVRVAEANAAAAQAERDAAELALQAANAEAERERIKAEREAARRSNGPRTRTPNTRTPRTERSGTATPNAGPDQAERPAPNAPSDGAEDVDAFAAWLEREGTDTPMTNRELAELLGGTVDAARTQANRWRRKANASTDRTEA